MSISLNRLIDINPSVIRAAGNAIDLNGVILTDNNYVPVGSVLQFSSDDTVLTKFGASSEEYEAASIYFSGVKNGTLKPSKLYFARFNLGESAAFLVGNNLKLTLDDLRSVTGNLSITINGKSQSVSLDFTSVNSFNDAVNLIQDGLTEAIVDYNSITKQFKITSASNTVATADSSIGYAYGDAATALGLTQNTGALISYGSDQATAQNFFKQLLSNTANWYSFTTLFAVNEDQAMDFASWVNLQEARFNYVFWTNEGAALVSGSDTQILTKIKAASYSNVTPVFCNDYTKPANILGYFASLNFNQPGGRVQLAYRTLDGLTPDITSDEEYEALTDNGYNFYGSYAANVDSFAVWQPGIVTGDFMWCDAHAGQAWVNANIQLTIFNTLAGNTNIPYNPVGRESFATPIITPAQQFKDWGGCVEGTDLDNNQKLEIKNLLGYDGSQGLYAKGYIIHVGQFTSTMRANRTTPPCYFIYADGGAFRTIKLNSVEVQ